MDKKNQNIILWIAGIVIFLIVVTQFPLPGFPFAIITKTTCAEKTLSYWDMEGNVLDTNNLNNGVNNGAVFVPGRLGQAGQFNTTTYISFPSISSENKTIIMWIKNYSTSADWYFASETNGVSGANEIIPLDSQFGLGFNGSVDEIVIFSPALTSEELSNFSTGIKACYTVSYEENVSCQDVATEQVTDPGYGCLNYSGDFFPNCDYEWIDASQYKIENNLCERHFYCENPCLTTGNCYVGNQDCVESLVYDCYLVTNNICVKKIDYPSCVTNMSNYENLTVCQADLNVTTTIPTGTPSITTETTMESIKSKLTGKVFEVAGFEVKLFHLLALLVLVIITLYFIGSKK